MILIAFTIITPKDGISKKLLAQARALSLITGNCRMFCLSEDGRFQTISFRDGALVSTEYGEALKLRKRALNRVDPFIDACEQALAGREEKLYIRHMVPSMRYLRFLAAQRGGIYYEIPTYPYYYEQFSLSAKKAMTAVRLLHETFFWPQIYRLVERIAAIPCRTDAKRLPKMRFISNGYTGEERPAPAPRRAHRTLNLLGVGTIQRYHGYEKLIRAIAAYDRKDEIRFTVVGGGNTAPLKSLAAACGVEEQVIFTGPKSGAELEALYAEADVGVGTLALEYRRADIDTGIKVIDYYVHGLPVLSSGICPAVEGLEQTPFYRYDGAFSLRALSDWLACFGDEARRALADRAVEQLSWTTIMERFLHD